MTGWVLSVTVKEVEQVVKFPAASVTVIVTVVAPVVTGVPAVGDCVMISSFVAVQLSVAVTFPVKSGRVAWHEAFAKADCAGAQVTMTGWVLSVTVKEVEHVCS